jgi:hypothetical protein
MNNYANWEITQLLPEINPYLPKIEYCEKQFNSWENKEKLLLPYWNDRGYIDCGIVQYKGEISSYYQHSNKDRDVWSFEDIRLYLESKGFSININHYVLQDIPYWCHLVNSIDRNSQDIGKFDTYEEAREEAIKWCLSK